MSSKRNTQKNITEIRLQSRRLGLARVNNHRKIQLRRESTIRKFQSDLLSNNNNSEQQTGFFDVLFSISIKD